MSGPLARSVEEWIGANDDAKIPDRVRQRVVTRANQCCQNCGVRVRHSGEVDHAVALILGGPNRESNLRFLCANCHAAKTKADVAAKSRAAKKQKRLGPLVKPQSAWSKKPEAYEYDWKLRKYVPRAHRNPD